MTQIRETNILDMIDLYGEENCKSILSSFVSPLSKDVEDFIHNKAINFAMQRIAITFLVFLEKEERLFLMGYYTLSNKFVSVSDNMLSKTMQKRIAKCASNPKLYEFYSNHNFRSFGQRNKEKYELTEGAMLVQMLRYFKS